MWPMKSCVDYTCNTKIYVASVYFVYHIVVKSKEAISFYVNTNIVVI